MTRRISISRSAAEDCLRSLEKEAFGLSYRLAAEELRRALAPKPRKVLVQSKKRAPRSGSRSIRAAVFLRACGHCEACHNLSTRSDPLTWDHAHGRVKEKESVENTWALHLSCHRRRTNGPRLEWLWNYRDHSWKHGHHAEVRWAEREIEFAKDKIKLDAMRAEVAGG